MQVRSKVNAETRKDLESKLPLENLFEAYVGKEKKYAFAIGPTSEDLKDCLESGDKELAKIVSDRVKNVCNTLSSLESVEKMEKEP